MSDETTTIAPEVQAIIDAKVAEAVTGLKTKNGEVIGLNKQLKAQLDDFQNKYAGIDPEAVTSMMKRFASDEEAGLLKAGKLDEVIKNRTDRMSADFNKKLTDEAGRATRAEAKAAKLADRTLAGALRDAAIKSGALPEALEDIVLRSRNLWRLNDDGEAMAMNGEEVVLGKDGKTPLTPIEWAESLREIASHLWPRAQGTGAPGSSRTTDSGNKKITRSQLEALPPSHRAGALKDAVLVD